MRSAAGAANDCHGLVSTMQPRDGLRHNGLAADAWQRRAIDDWDCTRLSPERLPTVPRWQA
jgi:hypothetical protein